MFYHSNQELLESFVQDYSDFINDNIGFDKDHYDAIYEHLEEIVLDLMNETIKNAVNSERCLIAQIEINLNNANKELESSYDNTHELNALMLTFIKQTLEFITKREVIDLESGVSIEFVLKNDDE